MTLVGDPDDPVTLRTISCQMPVDLPALCLLNLSWLGFPAGSMFTKALRGRIPAVSEMLANRRISDYKTLLCLPPQASQLTPGDHG